VTIGSSTERIEATDGPTRARPAKNKMMAPTVLTRASVMSHVHAATPTWSEGPPRTTAATVYVDAAPQHTRVVSVSGATPDSNRSPVRMYAV
jgi:hypothetical protein